MAGGLEGGIGSLCFEILKGRVDDVLLSKEEGIRNAVRWMAENHSIVIEPSSAVVIDAMLSSRLILKEPVLLVISGRNVSWDIFKRVSC